MENRKLITFCLIIAILFTFTSGLYACGSEKEDDPNTENSSAAENNSKNSGAQEQTNEQRPTEAPVEIPETNLEGFVFNVATNDTTYVYDMFDIEEQNGEYINDAIYSRNMAIEERFNCEIKQTLLATPAATVKKAILAGDTSYSIIDSILLDIHPLANEHLFLDLNEVPYVKDGLSKSWWDQNLPKELAIHNKLYYNTGDIAVRDDLRIAIMYFNKDLFKKLGLDFPYEYVKKGTWTIDTLLNFVKGVNADLNGDGEMGQYDQWGFMSEWGAGLHLFHASGEKIAKLNSAREPELVFNSQRAQEVIQKVLSVTEDGVTMFHADTIKEVTTENVWTEASKFFQEGRFLIRSSVFEPIVRDLRAMPTDFGILPFVKFDERQEEYYSSVGVGAYVVAVPNNSDAEKVGMVLESLACLSQSTLTPAFYEISLRSKFLRDNESEEMLDIIFKSKHYDIGHLFNIGGYQGLLPELVKNKKTDFASAFEKLQNKANTDIEKLIANY